MIAKNCYLICDTDKKTFYQKQMQEFYLIGIHFVQTPQDADLILVIDTDTDITSIKKVTDAPIFVIDKNFASNQVKRTLIGY